MKVRIIKASEHSFWYKKHINEVFDVVQEYYNRYEVKNDKISFGLVRKEDCEVVDDNMDFFKHRWEEDKLKDIINETKSDPNMKQIKMSIDTAREWYKLAKENNIDGKTNPAINWLLENFTKEELIPKKGFTWEESFSGNGFYITEDSFGYSKVMGHSNLFKTKAQADSAIAFAQLSHIVAKYNEGKANENVFWVVCHKHNIDKILYLTTERVNFGDNMQHLVFMTKEDAKLSMEVNRELWEKYWMIKKD